MLPLPKRYFLTAAACEGSTALNAFDGALLKARVGNTNLLRVSSILPPDCVYTPDLAIPAGSLLPIAYGTISSDSPGTLISAAVAVGKCSDGQYGLIMEYEGYCTRAEAKERVLQMLQDGFTMRGLELKHTQVAACEHVVEKIGCVFAAVPLWY
mgnify:CR=1 FL=1